MNTEDMIVAHYHETVANACDNILPPNVVSIVLSYSHRKQALTLHGTYKHEMKSRKTYESHSLTLNKNLSFCWTYCKGIHSNYSYYSNCFRQQFQQWNQRYNSNKKLQTMSGWYKIYKRRMIKF